MLVAAEKLVEAAFTTTAVNTQITAVNTALSVSGTACAARINGLTEAPQNTSSFPLLVYMVGAEAGDAETRRFGKRDTSVPVVLRYVSKHTTLASAKTDVQVALEAFQTVLETLPGTQQGSSARYCVDVTDISMRFITYEVEADIIRHGGECRFVMLMRTEG